MPSFDTTLEADVTEVRNAVDQASKEIGTRFDFKGSSAKVEQKERELTCYADNEFQLGQVREVLISKCAKRQVDVRFLSHGDIQKISGDKIKQVLTVRHGIAGDDAKRIVRILKDSKMKVQAAIQGDTVRVTGGKRDDLQAAIALLRKEVDDLPAHLRKLPRLTPRTKPRFGPRPNGCGWTRNSQPQCRLTEHLAGPHRQGNIAHQVFHELRMVVGPLRDIFFVGA